MKSRSIGIDLLANGSEISVTQMLGARKLLEVPAVRLGAERATPEDLNLIGLSLDPKTQPNGCGVELTSSWTFHSLVVHAADNPLLELVAEPIFLVWTHRAIAGAIRKGDNFAAAESMRSHLTYLRSDYATFLTEQR